MRFVRQWLGFMGVAAASARTCCAPTSSFDREFVSSGQSWVSALGKRAARGSLPQSGVSAYRRK